MLRKDLRAIYVHQWKGRRVDDIACNDHNLSTARIICFNGGANYVQRFNKTENYACFGRLCLLLTSSNTLVLTIWRSKSETPPPPKDIEIPRFIDCDMQI